MRVRYRKTAVDQRLNQLVLSASFIQANRTENSFTEFLINEDFNEY